MSVRRLPVDKRMVRRRRKGMQPDPDHVIALFSLAADVALLYVLLLALNRLLWASSWRRLTGFRLPSGARG